MWSTGRVEGEGVKLNVQNPLSWPELIFQHPLKQKRNFFEN